MFYAAARRGGRSALVPFRPSSKDEAKDDMDGDQAE